MNRTQMLLAVVLSATITFFLRALPFFAFRGGRKMPEKLIYLGKVLPSAIMAVLIVYCLKNTVVNFKGCGGRELISVLLVVFSYKWKHNTLLSIMVGTVCNMILLRMV